ncbi:MAG: hypothetical protein ACK4UN_13025 [Limisphaerales bacterium]
MWIKRTEEEMVEEHRRKQRLRLKIAVVAGLFATVIVSILFEVREPGQSRREQLLSKLPWAAGGGLVAGFILYRFIRGRETMICPKCEKTKWNDGDDQCTCGGHFEPIDSMKHVSDS